MTDADVTLGKLDEADMYFPLLDTTMETVFVELQRTLKIGELIQSIPHLQSPDHLMRCVTSRLSSLCPHVRVHAGGTLSVARASPC